MADQVRRYQRIFGGLKRPSVVRRLPHCYIDSTCDSGPRFSRNFSVLTGIGRRETITGGADNSTMCLAITAPEFRDAHASQLQSGVRRIKYPQGEEARLSKHRLSAPGASGVTAGSGHMAVSMGAPS